MAIEASRLILLLSTLSLVFAAPAAAQDEDEDKPLLPLPPDGLGNADGLGRFEFGSYGRVSGSWNLQGGPGRPMHVVGSYPRLGKAPYVELDLRYRKNFQAQRGPIAVRTVFTLALTEGFFHFTGDWATKLAVRNLYIEASSLFGGHLDLWVGSRMFRGDDVYLLDLWPLDDLNTWGGGAGVHFGRFDAKVHVGVNRLLGDYQYQQLQVRLEDQPASTGITVLDRQRTVVSGQAEYRFGTDGASFGAKAKVYAELHLLPEGVYSHDFDEQELLPSDRGFLVGAQFGLWGFGERSWANVFVRYASGLAAYDELGTPFGLDADKRATSARQFQVALSANWEKGPIGLMLGAYLRNFADADGITQDRDDGWEGSVALRPTIFVTNFFHQSFEVSYEQKRPNGLEPETLLPLQPSMFRVSAMPVLAFSKGSLSRPHLFVLYSLGVPSKGALLDLPLGDPRRDGCDPRGDCTIHPQHYLGIGAEWWFNSSYQ